MPLSSWMLEGRSGHVVILRAEDTDCLDGDPWGGARCRKAVEAFNTALGLERPQYVLTYEDGMVQAVVYDVDDAVDAELGRAYQLGMAGGYSGAAADVREAGVTLWKQGRDAEARFLRELAERIEEKARKARPALPSEVPDAG